MVIATQTKKYSYFGLGLNFRDDENELREGETPYAINNDLSNVTGLISIKGWDALWSNLARRYDITWFSEYTADDGMYRWIAISYPNILLIDPVNGSVEVIYDTWHNRGRPFGRQVKGDFVLVDGTHNAPLYISGRTVTEITWPPSYSDANNAAGSTADDPGNIIDSYLNQGSSQQPTAGPVSFFVYHKNRLIFNDTDNPRRLLFSQVSDITDFSDNDPDAWDIAFFVDLPISKPITALQVLSNEFLAVHCDGQILVMSGDNPPGAGYSAPHFAFDVVNSSVGALHHDLVASRGDNDHYFVANNGRIYSLKSTDNFQQAKPVGLTSKIFSFFANLDNKTLKRGKLINHEIRGELVFWVPSKNTKRYPDQQLVLHYDSPSGEAVWSLRRGFGDSFKFRGCIIDRDDRMIICKDGYRFLQAHKGTSYDGEAIDMIYQFPTADFGAPNNNKHITSITAYGNSPSGTQLFLGHLWDNGKDALTPFSLDAAEPGLFDDSDTLFDTTGDVFTSDVGVTFQQKRFSIANRYGKKLKMRLEHRSDTANVTISSLILDFKPMGK